MGKIAYKILTNKNLLLQQFSGKTSKNDLAAFFTVLYDDPEYLKVSYIFSDFSNADIALTAQEMEEVALFIIEHAPKNSSVLNAIVVKEPLVTAYSLIYKEVMQAMPNYVCEVFSTYSSAARFLDLKKAELEQLVKENL